MQSDLAYEIGIGQASVEKYESGRYESSRPVLLSSTLLTGVDWAWLTETDPRGPVLARIRRGSKNRFLDAARSPGVMSGRHVILEVRKSRGTACLGEDGCFRK
jgi:hypothetical protein